MPVRSSLSSEISFLSSQFRPLRKEPFRNLGWRGIQGCVNIIQRLTTSISPKQSQKTFRIKQKLAKAQKQNRPIPQWIRLRTGNTIRYEHPHERETRLLPPSTRVSPSDGRTLRKIGKLTHGKTGTTPSGDTGARPASTSKCPPSPSSFDPKRISVFPPNNGLVLLLPAARPTHQSNKP